MTTTNFAKASRVLIAVGTSNAAGATTRGTVDLRTALGGLLTFKITNGATGPTVQASANILVSHNAGATPAAGSAGAEWKTVYQVANGVATGTVGEFSYDVPAGVMHLEAEITGNTGQAVTCEALFSELSSAVSV